MIEISGQFIIDNLILNPFLVGVGYILIITLLIVGVAVSIIERVIR